MSPALAGGFSTTEPPVTCHVLVTQSCPTLCNPWAVAHQAPLSMGFSRQEYWSGLPFPSPEDLPDPGIEPRSPSLQADALTSAPPGRPRFNPWVGKIPWRRKWQPIPVLLPGESHGQRSLMGSSHSSVQSLSHVQLFATPRTAARQSSLSSIDSHSLLKLMSIKSVMPSNCNRRERGRQGTNF